MINLRYHIVSITAVFLALGIGLTLGSTFLDRVTVDTLKNQLDAVQERVEETQAENAELRDLRDALEERDRDLADELSERLVSGHLEDVPVLVVASEGTPEDLLEQVTRSVSGAGADLAGTWWITDRWSLGDAEVVEELASLLEVSSADPDRLRRNASIRLAEVLSEAASATPPAPVAGVAGEAATPAVADGPAEPELAATLEEAGFLEYDVPAGTGSERVLLPAHELRLLVISSMASANGAQALAGGLVEELAADGPAAVVAAQAEVDLTDEDGQPASDDARRTTFVGPLRTGELTRERVSTIDDLDTAAGLAATVLALEDLREQRIGHYGVASGAARLLPGTDPDT